uniref:Uncharacterized protein n=1 Tax=Chlorocebus sabaeus TaxID=60711 RepID=A0A0D9RYQ1_CHLSB
SRGRHHWSGGAAVSSGYPSNILEQSILSCCSERKDANPKSVVYSFFMQEQCAKGEK